MTQKRRSRWLPRRNKGPNEVPFDLNVEYIEALEEVTGGNVTEMLNATLNLLIAELSSLHNGDQKAMAHSLRRMLDTAIGVLDSGRAVIAGDVRH